MGNEKQFQKDAVRVLKETSRTFFIPISLLKPTLKMTVGSAYLCMRAIDEIEDHEQLEANVKQELLRSISSMLKGTFNENTYLELIKPYEEKLPEVTLRLSDWLAVCPEEILGKVKESTSIMADGMAKWVEKDWVINSKDDLDDYTYYVAGLVGVMLSDIWEWYDGTKTDRNLAIGYGRGLQAVNMLRNQDEDAERGVRFLPNDWNRADLFAYAERNLKQADQYIESIHTKSILRFCKIPLALAKRTLRALKNGEEKMSRMEVESTVDEIINE
ncbi:squalene/phytoene synthase family protein [Oceanobacillus halophilus]|uniref:Phytoene/squalene synthase family protein n=1 Tax=Oceanobacillus halophilus TaxID=930130 RepID=A0A495A1D2_9BACI|nr:phytoene/squalene synthase family protein [Oceanobacillus halophilus]RKQ33251.1 phytoene/squalene synthase family protein [Oceanobacillus halophilus]